MEEKRDFYQIIEEIYAKDNRYKPDSYEFLMQALHFTQNKLKRQSHINGRELSEGIREFVIEQYGAMSLTVLSHWGINKTEDFGNIVFNLVGKGLLAKTESDSIKDFNSVYDFKAAFGNILSEAVKDIKL